MLNFVKKSHVVTVVPQLLLAAQHLPTLMMSLNLCASTWGLRVGVTTVDSDHAECLKNYGRAVTSIGNFQYGGFDLQNLIAELGTDSEHLCQISWQSDFKLSRNHKERNENDL